MTADWTPLKQELALWRRAGLDLPFWWRDDDAVAQTGALDTLLALAQETAMPLHLAVIPHNVETSLVSALLTQPGAVPLTHGWRHLNHATPPAKTCEFPDGRRETRSELEASFARMHDHFGSRACPVFVPPWNRMGKDVPRVLAELGYRAVSTFGPRSYRHAAAGLVQINTHLDPIDWRGSRGLVAEADLIARLTTALKNRRTGQEDASEPFGLLTHHLVHDVAIWQFCARCLNTLMDGGARPVDLRTYLEDTNEPT